MNKTESKIMGLAALMVLSFLPIEANAQTSLDSTAVAIRVKTLNTRKAELRKEIETEDKKRDKVVEGVSPEVNERINMEQDSVCLALRSELVSVELELNEIAPNATETAIIRQYNALKRQNAAEPPASGQATKEER